MKTNNVIVRPMGRFEVSQRTKDGMFNATSLLRQWNIATGEKKEIKKFFGNQNTKEFISALIQEENLNGENFAYLKSRGKYNGGTWMHPILFTKFAMWLNPSFEVQVIKFVYSQMVEYRKEAGDAYKRMFGALASIVPREQMKAATQKVAKAISFVIFNEWQPMLRNKPRTEQDMKEYVMLERSVASLIDDAFVSTLPQVIGWLRRKWRRKFG